MKYIVLRSPNGEAPVLFSRALMHSYVVEIFRPLEVIAAGFARITDGSIECDGASPGMGIRSRPGRDSALVSAMLNDTESTVSRTSPVDAGAALPLSTGAGRR
jgi:hypothetical protein